MSGSGVFLVLDPAAGGGEDTTRSESGKVSNLDALRH
jgi:hypothetical protein